MTAVLAPSVLLQQYNPVLVMLPQDFTRLRPYQPWFSRSRVPRGDYHPCSAAFFLSHVTVRKDGARSYSIGPVSRRRLHS